ncbi:ferredoxin reductase-like protein [Linderina pennispora]|uniref:cytochrome-b5 reductase n=1 Tax=Linderina pennispora TaxID=61395 RepID=A0A1Y1WJE4_9FUNG|nr:ferredoxin reductase-like protein [Linderina pennispora]ORX73346.1 ferredoxin reductase-like protein [Linderina pennispora]
MPRTARGNGLAVVGGLALTGLGAAAYNFLNNKQLTFQLDSDKKLGNYTSSAVLFRSSAPTHPCQHELQRGSCDFVIKRYDDGQVSPALHDLGPGDKVEMWGPIPNFSYKPSEYTDIGMIAGGSGLTPMFQLINRVVNDPNDKTRITLVFANKSKDDHPDKFKVHYVLTKASEDWTGELGYVDREKIQKYMPPASTNSLIAVCGPPAMMKTVCGSKPNELGYKNVYKF